MSARTEASAAGADDVDDEELVAGVVPTVASEKVNSAGMHARDSERLAGAAQKAALASFVQEKGDMQIKFRQLMEIDKALRQKGRNTRERTPLAPELPPVPNPGDSM